MSNGRPYYFTSVIIELGFRATCYRPTALSYQDGMLLYSASRRAIFLTKFKAVENLND